MPIIYLGETRGTLKKCMNKDGRWGLFGKECKTYNASKNKKCTKCGKRI